MQKSDIIQLITPQMYSAECEAARRAAPFTGEHTAAYKYSSEIPLDISEAIWEATDSLTPVEQVHLLFDVYIDLPCYSLLSDLYIHRYRSLPHEAKDVFWTYIIAFLSQEDAMLAEPIVYSLYVDFFEDPNLCSEAWGRLVTDEANQWQVQRVLKGSAAVPWNVKHHLYQRLVRDPAWHSAIYESVVASYYNVYGQIDKVEAKRIVDRLLLPDDHPYRAKFTTALTLGERYANSYRDRLGQS